jgi:hypothetical protein
VVGATGRNSIWFICSVTTGIAGIGNENAITGTERNDVITHTSRNKINTFFTRNTPFL